MAEAQALEAQAGAVAGVLGVKASANATVGRVSAGLANTPITASAEGPGAAAGAGLHAGHIGAYAGAHFGEVAAGPFAARAGVKFGGGIENGIPILHAGPASAPCCIM